MTKLVITRGLPGSGKSTYAKQWVAEDPDHRARVNRDDIRSMLNDGYFKIGLTEGRVIGIRDAAIKNLLRNGVSVICDDTNLRKSVAKGLMRLAERVGAEFEVVDFLDVPIDKCIVRDAARPNRVGPAVIHDLYERFMKGKDLTLNEISNPVEMIPYKAPSGKYIAPAVICDIDGTIAQKGDRDIYDDTKVHLDTVNRVVYDIIIRENAEILFITGRDEKCRQQTEEWLDEKVWEGASERLWMRPAGDTRDDSIVKYELFDKHIRDYYNIRFVLDDRDRVVQMWRKIGLTVLQVADGDF